jgi:hypothetical protein
VEMAAMVSWSINDGESGGMKVQEAICRGCNRRVLWHRCLDP